MNVRVLREGWTGTTYEIQVLIGSVRKGPVLWSQADADLDPGAARFPDEVRKHAEKRVRHAMGEMIVEELLKQHNKETA